MAFKSEEFLEFAVKIHSEPDLQSPAGVRTAVSRCYYSALLTAKSSLEHLGMEFRRNDDIHEDVVRALSREHGVTSREMVDDLSDMNELRMAADLDVESHVGIDCLGSAIAMANIFSKDLSRRFGA